MLRRNRIALVVVGAGLALGSAYVIFTGDANVARTVRTVLARYVRAPCTFESASFTFLNGLDVRGLRVLDPDDPLGPPLLEARRALFDYTLGVGGAGPRVTVVEIDAPRIRLERAKDGTFAIARILAAPEGAAGPLPRIVVRDGAAAYADAELLAGAPIELAEISVSVVPATRLTTEWAGATIEMTATSDVLGAVTARAAVGRDGEPTRVAIDLPRIALDAAVASRFAGDAAQRIASVSPHGTATAHVEARLVPGAAADVEAVVVLRDVSLSASLPEADAAPPAPISVTGLAGTLKLSHGRVETTDLRLDALGAAISASGSLTGIGTGTTPVLAARASLAHLAIREAVRDHAPLVVRRLEEVYNFAGTLDADAVIEGDPARPTVRIDAHVADGGMRYEGWVQKDGIRRGFPYDVTALDGKLALADGVLRFEGSGVHGPASIRAKGSVTFGTANGDVPDVQIDVADVPLDADVRTGFGVEAPIQFDRWAPGGVAKHVSAHVWRSPAVPGQHDAIDVTLDLDGRASFRPHLFPSQLSDVRGRVEILEPLEGDHHVSLVRLTDLNAKGDGFTMRVSGTVRGAEPKTLDDITLHIDVDDAAGEFRRAVLEEGANVPKGAKAAYRRLSPSGAIGIDARLRSFADRPRDDRVEFELRQTAVAGWGDIPLATRDLTGRVVVDGLADTITFDGVAGHLAMNGFSPAVRGRGRLLNISADEPTPDVHLDADSLPLGDALRQALGPLAERAKAFFTQVRPVGTAKADLSLDIRPPSHATPFEMTLTHIHGALLPLGLELDNDDGTFHYDTRHATIKGLESSIGSAALRIEEADYDLTTGSLDVVAEFRGLHFPEDVEGPLSHDVVAKIAEEAPNRTLHGSLRIQYRRDPQSVTIAGLMSVRPRTRRVVRDPGLAPDGTVAIDRLVFWMPEGYPVRFQGETRATDFSFEPGLSVTDMNGPLLVSGEFGDETRIEAATERASMRVEDYPFREVTAKVEKRPLGARVAVTAGKFMGGDVTGYVGPADGSVKFRGAFKLANADLGQLTSRSAQPGTEPATGRLDGEIAFENRTGAREDLRGAGRIDVTDGRLLPVPVVGDIVRFASLGVVSPMLDTARLTFDVDGDWLKVRDLDITGPLGSIGNSSGRIGLDGRLDLLVFPQFDPGVPGVSWIFKWFLKPFAVRIHGTIRNPDVVSALAWQPSGDRGREPQPAGDVEAPARLPW